MFRCAHFCGLRAIVVGLFCFVSMASSQLALAQDSEPSSVNLYEAPASLSQANELSERVQEIRERMDSAFNSDPKKFANDQSSYNRFMRFPVIPDSLVVAPSSIFMASTAILVGGSVWGFVRAAGVRSGLGPAVFEMDLAMFSWSALGVASTYYAGRWMLPPHRDEASAYLSFVRSRRAELQGHATEWDIHEAERFAEKVERRCGSAMRTLGAGSAALTLLTAASAERLAQHYHPYEKARRRFLKNLQKFVPGL
jgi:hypothetical protein